MNLRIPIAVAAALVLRVGVAAAQGPAPDTTALSEAAVEERPVLVPGSCSTPAYPVLLRSARIEGRVMLQFVVDTTGRVEPTSIHALQSTHRYFTEAASRAVASCRYRPAKFNNHPVRVVVNTPVNFQLAHT